MEVQVFISTWLVPVGATLLSIWFAVSAKRDSDKSAQTLNQVNEAIQGWQSQIMQSTASILDSTPQVIEAKVRLEKVGAARAIIQSMQTAIEISASDPKGGASGHTQVEQLKEMGNQLSKILEHME
ncbi:hypothetical protein [Pseudocolwellia sp. HL-MZ7]|uniref:hypothetical protein n=1 Tax=Pseudocolwellia sp. HL-MZ7 TaxID=3400627 RepID=UPI003CF70DF0